MGGGGGEESAVFEILSPKELFKYANILLLFGMLHPFTFLSKPQYCKLLNDSPKKALN